MKRILIFISVASVFLFQSCRKEGVDGDATVLVYLEHHGNPIINQANYKDTVFVKFDATELPANPTTNYDAMFVGEGTDAFVKLKNLKWGNYFLYGTGWDTQLNDRVTGGAAFYLKRKDRKKETSIKLAVTE